MGIETYTSQTVQRYPRSGYDSQGKPSFGSASSVLCRFTESTERIKDAAGNEYIIDAKMWVDADQTMALEDKIVYNSINYKVVFVKENRELDGEIHHKRIHLQRTKQ